MLHCSVNHKTLLQVGKLHRCLVKPDTLELTEQCKEETGLTLEDVAKAEPLDKVLQQVSLRDLNIGIISPGRFTMDSGNPQH